MLKQEQVKKYFVLTADLLLAKSPKMALPRCFCLDRCACLGRSSCSHRSSCRSTCRRSNTAKPIRLTVTLCNACNRKELDNLHLLPSSPRTTSASSSFSSNLTPPPPSVFSAVVASLTIAELDPEITLAEALGVLAASDSLCNCLGRGKEGGMG